MMTVSFRSLVNAFIDGLITPTSFKFVLFSFTGIYFMELEYAKSDGNYIIIWTK